MSCTGVILAGGGAMRFGGAPKGLELVGGRRIIDRVAGALREVTDELLLVANAPDAPTWVSDLRTERDLRTGAGALGGLHAALAHAGSDVLVVAWDMPFVSAALLGELRRLGEGGGEATVNNLGGPRSGAPAASAASTTSTTSTTSATSATSAPPAVPPDAVLPESDRSRRGVEPLCAWYSQRCLGAIERALDEGDLRVIGFHDAVRVTRLPIDRVQAFGDPARIFANVNTRDDLVQVRQGPRGVTARIGQDR